MAEPWRAMDTTGLTTTVDEAGLAVFARHIAVLLSPRDTIRLEGDLGAGKTTFARHVIAALSPHEVEVASPTFAIAHTYDTTLGPLAHFDLYRLGGVDDLIELGFEETLASHVSLIEWPGCADALLPADALTLRLSVADDPGQRMVVASGGGAWAKRLDRLTQRLALIERAGWAKAWIERLPGDASVRRYDRLLRPPANLCAAPASALLMDAPRATDGPKLEDGRTYSQIAHLAESVSAFTAVGEALRGFGLSTPALYGIDDAAGVLLIEDFGASVFQTLYQEAGAPDQERLVLAAVDALVALRASPPPTDLPIPGRLDGQRHRLARYDADALAIEVDLLPTWYAPMAGLDLSADAIAAYRALWAPLIEGLQQEPDHWVLRDVHSPNLLWLPEREAPADVGFIDFQDAVRGPAAYDLVSLLQDARCTVPAYIEARALAAYIAGANAKPNANANVNAGAADAPQPSATFNEAAFRASYAVLGGQRACKILGIFARLAKRDGKPQYLRHLPRLWAYLDRNLTHPALAELKAWCDTHVPASAREPETLNPAGENRFASR
ncbi:MAG: tRNA (adenosine(37)-N6)-threonylcarbamoyltransferase complex ATPase subunit type 1 TsaE [Pseudomonadota bacterium]